MIFEYLSSDKTCHIKNELEQRRCIAIKPNQKQCKLTSIFLPYCQKHTKTELGLEVKTSTLPNAGNGLFALKEFQKYDIITEYIGDKITNTNADEIYGVELNDLIPYGVSLNSRYIIDSACVRGIGSLANDSRSSKINNASLIIEKGHVFLQATKKILIGQEVFVNYGNEYFTKANTEAKPIFSTTKKRPRD